MTGAIIDILLVIGAAGAMALLWIVVIAVTLIIYRELL